MASENADPLDGASPNAFHSHEPDSYDDLLGVQIPIETLDLPMPDFQGEFDQPGLAIDSQSIPDIAMEIPNTQACKDINTDNTATAKPNSMLPRHEAVKKDLPNGSSPSKGYDDHVIEIFDTENNISIKEEDYEDPFNWTSIPNDVISISDDDDDDNDVLMLRADASSVPIKKEDDEVKVIWEKMGDRIIELDSDDEPNVASKPNLGKSFLRGLDPKARRPFIDRSAAIRAQEAYLQAHRRKHDIPEPSNNVGFSARQGIINGQGPKRSDLSVEEDGCAWMNADYTPDEDTGRKFRALKKSYNAKVQKDDNTLNDDIEFAKAEKAENLRLARLKAEYEDALGYSDEDNSDDGLFVSSASTRTSRSKRRANDDLNSKDENPDTRSSKQRKSDNNRKQIQQELDQEQVINLMAGIEGAIHKMNGEGNSSGKKGKGKYNEKVKALKRKKRKPNEAGYLNNSTSLLTSNVYEDADANLNREALPVSGHTHKKKALAALVASVPLGTTEKDARAEKNHIFKSTVTLGRGIKRGCKADGENDWKLAGMKSSLRHHQVQGAAFMKERETGCEEPLGGILVSLPP